MRNGSKTCPHTHWTPHKRTLAICDACGAYFYRPRKIPTREAMSRGGHASARARRGFDVPPELQADYNHLIKVKKYRAREAGKILGII